ncbi:MAG TPA: hypothetical protein VIF62_01240 [Labilithrix sp.]
MSTDGDLDARPDGLLAWQWNLYPRGHTTRANLLIHALTVPLFLGGTLALLASPVLGVAAGVGGVVGMGLAVGAQGRGHRREKEPPVPFRGPLDVAARLFVEQWITFPRFVLSGAFRRAWRGAGAA